MASQQDWVKTFRKSVKASCPKGWLVMPSRKESMRVQVWSKSNRIADVTIPYSWSESDWPNALLRIKTAAKAYEESDRKLDIKTCFSIAHTVSSDNPTDWRLALKEYRQALRSADPSVAAKARGEMYLGGALWSIAGITAYAINDPMSELAITGGGPSDFNMLNQKNGMFRFIDFENINIGFALN